MENNAEEASSTSPKRRKTLPEVEFSPFCEGQYEMCDRQKRRAVVRVWVTLLVTNMLLLIVISIWAVHRSHERERQTFGKCYEAPKVPGDRRRNKDQISVVNFNAEWLFMRGGHGDIRCPSESCPWAVPNRCNTTFPSLICLDKEGSYGPFEVDSTRAGRVGR